MKSIFVNTFFNLKMKLKNNRFYNEFFLLIFIASTTYYYTLYRYILHLQLGNKIKLLYHICHIREKNVLSALKKINVLFSSYCPQIFDVKDGLLLNFKSQNFQIYIIKQKYIVDVQRRMNNVEVRLKHGNSWRINFSFTMHFLKLLKIEKIHFLYDRIRFFSTRIW